MQDHIGEEGALFWIHPTYAGEGELQVGLATLADVTVGIAANNTVEVAWFTRKAKAHAWPTQTVAFKVCIGGHDRHRRPLVFKSIEALKDFLPVAVDVSETSSAHAPKITKHGRDALFLYVAAEEEPELMVQPPAIKRRGGHVSNDGNDSRDNEEEGSDIEEMEECSDEASEASEASKTEEEDLAD